jgi:hypothetical protein
MPRLSRLAVFLTGTLLGLALWLIPTLLSKEPLPWDSQGPVYGVALLLLGVILGFLGAGQPIAAVSGLFLGQLLVLLGRVVGNPSTSELWLVSTMLLAGYSFVAGGLGSVIGGALRRRFALVPRRGDRRGT